MDTKTQKYIFLKLEDYAKRCLDNLTAEELLKNRLYSHWPLGVDQSELPFAGGFKLVFFSVPKYFFAISTQKLK